MACLRLHNINLPRMVGKKKKGTLKKKLSEKFYWSLTLYQTTKFNPFPNNPWFSRVCSTSLMKTLWEKEQLLVTSNFSFSRIDFY